MIDSLHPPPDVVLEQVVDRFWETIPPLWNRLRARIRAVAAEEFDLTVEQFHILRHIRMGVRTTSELAAAKNISRPAVSQAVEVLVNKGLVGRARSEIDRRCVDLELTAAGSALLDAVFEDMRGWMKGKFASFSLKELDSLLQALESLKNTFLSA
jgi:DNA-binding MarR family transcriptional regulator